MNVNHRKGAAEFEFGYNMMSEMGGIHGDMLMDFGVLRMSKGQVFEDTPALEKAYLLVYGAVKLEWEGHIEIIGRENCFDNAPWVLHLPLNIGVKITALADDSEITVHRVENNTNFSSKLYTPEECHDEYRGAGTMGETSTRIVRTVFDKSNAPWSNLVLGEVIGFPGKWSSYPPHHHPQPEIYYYKCNPQNGFGYCDLGSEVLKVQNNDTVFITEGHIHPHVTAPGYALWYMWVIRHLDGSPYTAPTFLPEHLWVTEPDAPIWPGKKET